VNEQQVSKKQLITPTSMSVIIFYSQHNTVSYLSFMCFCHCCRLDITSHVMAIQLPLL